MTRISVIQRSVSSDDDDIDLNDYEVVDDIV